MENLKLQEVANGALQEKANQALQKVFDNMQDPNTPWKSKRVVTIKMAFTQNEDRDDSTCEISVDTKLAPVKPVETKFSIGKNLKTGKVEAVEYGPGIKGQMTFEDLEANETIVDGKTVDMETGEITESKIIQMNFCIALQAKFLNDPASDRSLVLQFAGTVEDGTVAQYSDDGISQKATIKTGIASKGEAIVPNPVKLRPYRTFHEVQQPVSEFIFRMRSNHGIECALFEADGGAWENVAMKNIKEYLQMELTDLEKFTIIY